MKKYLFFVFLFTYSLLVVAQKPDRCFAEGRNPMYYTNCFVDSISIEEFDIVVNPQQITRSKVYSYKFTQNGFIVSCFEDNILLKKQSRTLFLYSETDGTFVSLFNCDLIDGKIGDRYYEKLLEKNDKIEIRGSQLSTDPLEDIYSNRCDTSYVKNTKDCYLVYSSDEKEFEISSLYDTNGRIVFKEIISGEQDAAEGINKQVDKYTYQYDKKGFLTDLLIEVEIDYHHKEKIKGAIVSSFKYEKIDEKGNWLMCMEFDHDEKPLKLYIREIFYFK